MRRIVLATLVAAAAFVLPAAQAMAYNGYTTTAANLRAGPDAGYPRIVTLPAGAAVQIHGCIDDWSWCDIQWRGERGWISAGLLAYDYRGHRVGVPAYGVRIGLPVLAFSFDVYWSNYYRNRSWYRQRDHWRSYRPSAHAQPHASNGRPPQNQPQRPVTPPTQANNRPPSSGHSTQGNGNRPAQGGGQSHQQPQPPQQQRPSNGGGANQGKKPPANSGKPQDKHD